MVNEIFCFSPTQLLWHCNCNFVGFGTSCVIERQDLLFMGQSNSDTFRSSVILNRLLHSEVDGAKSVTLIAEHRHLV